MKESPMLSDIGEKQDLANPQYIFEPSLDGLRAFYVKKDNKVSLYNRKGKNISDKFPELAIPDHVQAENCVLDGEIVVYNEFGQPDAKLLSQREHMSNAERINSLAAKIPAAYIAFDIINLNGEKLWKKPLNDRKAILEENVPNDSRIQRMFYTTDGLGLWDFIMARQLEGVVAKNRNSPYLLGKRSDNWLKIKNYKVQDCIIIGYAQGMKGVTALFLGAYYKDKLRFIGKVSKGLSAEVTEELYPWLHKLETEKQKAKLPEKYSGITPLKPKLACEIRYLDFGPDGLIRNPSLSRFRPDKHPKECVLELPETERRLINP